MWGGGENRLTKKKKKPEPVSEPLPQWSNSGSETGLKSAGPRDSLWAQTPILMCKGTPGKQLCHN